MFHESAIACGFAFPGGGVQSAARFFFSLARQGLEKESSIIKAFRDKKRNKSVIGKQKIGDFYIILRYNEKINRIKSRDTLLQKGVMKGKD